MTCRSPVRIALLSLLLTLSLAALYKFNDDPWRRKSQLETPQRMADLAAAPNTLKNWPPVVGAPFPDIEFTDHAGKRFSIEALRGRPTIVEIVGMTCAGCQAFSGGGRYGGFGGFPAQGGLKSIHEYFPEYTGGMRLDDGTINFLQILIYDLKLNPAKPSDLTSWREHFHFDKLPNTFIVTGGKALANKDSFKMIPGFLLLDRNLIVRYDAAGHSPRHNLYRDLLPAVRAVSEKP